MSSQPDPEPTDNLLDCALLIVHQVEAAVDDTELESLHSLHQRATRALDMRRLYDS